MCSLAVKHVVQPKQYQEKKKNKNLTQARFIRLRVDTECLACARDRTKGTALSLVLVSRYLESDTHEPARHQ